MADLAQPRLSSVRIFTADLDRARGFYGKVLGLEEIQADGEEGFAIFRAADGIMLMLETVELEDEEAAEQLIGRFTGLGFAVSSLSESFAALRAKGVRFDGLPERQPWGGFIAQCEDPDGNILTLIEYPKE